MAKIASLYVSLHFNHDLWGMIVDVHERWQLRDSEVERVFASLSNSL
jgi:hypothetical protein